MPEELRRNKLIGFSNDQAMMEAVYDLLLRSFLKKREYIDISMTAAERIAINLLNEAWEEVKSYRSDNKKDEPVNRTPHV